MHLSYEPSIKPSLQTEHSPLTVGILQFIGLSTHVLFTNANLFGFVHAKHCPLMVS
jgi:hypothetical protein